MNNPMSARATLDTERVYNVYDLLTDPTYSGIVTEQTTTDRLPHMVRTVYIQYHAGSGPVYLGTKGSTAVSATHHFCALTSAGNSWSERAEIANSIDLSTLQIFVGADSTIIGIRVDVF